MENIKKLKLENPQNINTTALAYLGDSVYELFVRSQLMKMQSKHVDALHKIGIKYVSAKGQCYAIKKIIDILYEDEMVIVRRSRNKKPISKAKNVDIMTYKWATAFESLLGYLYLSEKYERLNFIMKKGMEEIDEQGR